MLKALRNQLQAMAKDPNDPFTAFIRKRVGVREALRFEGPARKMILAMPSMIAQIRAWSDESSQPLEIKKMQSFALAYLYNPTDFLPEKTTGLFGYLDDAYLVASVFQKTIEVVPLAGLRPMEEDVLLKRSVAEWLDLTRELIPDESSQIDQILVRASDSRSTRYPARNRTQKLASSLRA